MVLSLPQGSYGCCSQEEKAGSYRKDLLINQVQELKWGLSVDSQLMNINSYGHI